MTVSNTTFKNVYVGTGSTDTYAYGFKIFDEDDLIVSEILISTGVETVLTKTADYTITGVGDDGGGNVTLVAGNLPSTKKLVLRRKIPLKQELDYIENDDFPAENHEAGLDRITLICQDLQEQINRTFLLTSDNETTLTMPALSNGKFLTNDGSALSWADITTVGAWAVKDEDDMASDSASALATQQSIKAYVDGKGFVDRGDPASVDYATGDLTKNDTWQNLDLSSIVPAGAVAVVLAVEVSSASSAPRPVLFRKDQNTNGINISRIETQVTGQIMTADVVVPCSSSRMIEYKGNSVGYGTLNITVKGWWI